jgi:serine/threonine protein kinase
MAGVDLPGLVCVRRLDARRGGAGPHAEERPEPPGTSPVLRLGGARLTYPTSPDRGPGDRVFLALRVDDGVEVAVRVYGRPVRTAEDRAKFQREAAELTALRGAAYVLPIHAADSTDAGQAYIVTDYCQAGSLLDHIAGVGRFTPAEACRIGAKLAGALATLHARGIYHRNLAPANVLIDSAGEPALSNFGLVSLATSDGDFAPPAPLRPRPFVAPEAYLPELMSVAADVYALGATLYAMLAGWSPRTVNTDATSVNGDNVADLPRTPWVLMSVIRQSMALDPLDRFASAEEFREALVSVPVRAGFLMPS